MSIVSPELPVPRTPPQNSPQRVKLNEYCVPRTPQNSMPRTPELQNSPQNSPELKGLEKVRFIRFGNTG